MKIYDKLMTMNVQISQFNRAKHWCEKSIPIYKGNECVIYNAITKLEFY